MGKQIAKPPTFEFVKFIAILRSPLGFGQKASASISPSPVIRIFRANSG
jgi:hypothetical protein